MDRTGIFAGDDPFALARAWLAEKGFEQMTVDEVAADVGIAKASLYKHFASKEALAAAAMARCWRRPAGHGTRPPTAAGARAAPPCRGRRRPRSPRS